MIRVFKVYYPVPILLLLGGEALITFISLLLVLLLRFGNDSLLILEYEYGFVKVLGATGVALLCLSYFDLYDVQTLRSRTEVYVRLLFAVGTLSLLLAILSYVLPSIRFGSDVFLLWISVLLLALMAWRGLQSRLINHAFARERVYVAGTGSRAQQLVTALRSRPEWGMDVVGWSGATHGGSLTREELGETLMELGRTRGVDRVIVALDDRRSVMPVQELLDLRLRGIAVEDPTDLLERISGKIEIDELCPSWLIFADGFTLQSMAVLGRRVFSVVMSLSLLIAVLPLIPLIALVIHLTSPGPILYRQKRVGRRGVIFNCYKFRTMRADAEADTGATWASDCDPRVTRVGHWLRLTRLDEIPQLWNVFKGDMNFIGPRPERPEFDAGLKKEIPYYHLRQIVRPGITGWAQINSGYGASIEQAKEKMRYDLYYIKNVSLALDLIIIFQTIKTVISGRGAR